ncbi:putative Dyggve-Melchior-Clausen syndrome protein [Blattamonas nauphoetae]|uniref:Dyggve-Melchior-Clausen syndrome protein n=1 Tax=Blattamonas nauphoetae TaxID=2049346 RepID=A0ABQ9XAL8_9EUKA|nr:putative Dyggve-Melchior-Clausen syndrome protein [Blattamonas nauphoetae]
MGTTASTPFQNHLSLFRNEPVSNSAYFEQFFRLMNTEQDFSILTHPEIRSLVRQRTDNIQALLDYILVTFDEFLDDIRPEIKETIINAVYVLTRLLSVLNEPEFSAFSRKYFWESWREKDGILKGKAFVNDIMRLLFRNKLTIDTELPTRTHDSRPPQKLNWSFIWESGLCVTRTKHTPPEYYKTRAVLLRLVIVLISSQIYYPIKDASNHQDPWLDAFSAPETPFKAEFALSLLNSFLTIPFNLRLSDEQMSSANDAGYVSLLSLKTMNLLLTHPFYTTLLKQRDEALRQQYSQNTQQAPPPAIQAPDAENTDADSGSEEVNIPIIPIHAMKTTLPFYSEFIHSSPFLYSLAVHVTYCTAATTPVRDALPAVSSLHLTFTSLSILASGVLSLVSAPMRAFSSFMSTPKEVVDHANHIVDILVFTLYLLTEGGQNNRSDPNFAGDCSFAAYIAEDDAYLNQLTLSLLFLVNVCIKVLDTSTFAPPKIPPSNPFAPIGIPKPTPFTISGDATTLSKLVTIILQMLTFDRRFCLSLNNPLVPSANTSNFSLISLSALPSSQNFPLSSLLMTIEPKVQSGTVADQLIASLVPLFFTFASPPSFPFDFSPLSLSGLHKTFYSPIPVYIVSILANISPHVRKLSQNSASLLVNSMFGEVLSASFFYQHLPHTLLFARSLFETMANIVQYQSNENGFVILYLVQQKDVIRRFERKVIDLPQFKKRTESWKAKRREVILKRREKEASFAKGLKKERRELFERKRKEKEENKGKKPKKAKRPEEEIFDSAESVSSDTDQNTPLALPFTTQPHGGKEEVGVDSDLSDYPMELVEKAELIRNAMKRIMHITEKQMKKVEESMMVFPKVERGAESGKASGIASGLVAMKEASEKAEKEEERDEAKGEEKKSDQPPSTDDHPTLPHSPSTPDTTQPDTTPLAASTLNSGWKPPSSQATRKPHVGHFPRPTSATLKEDLPPHHVLILVYLLDYYSPLLSSVIQSEMKGEERRAREKEGVEDQTGERGRIVRAKKGRVVEELRKEGFVIPPSLVQSFSLPTTLSIPPSLAEENLALFLQTKHSPVGILPPPHPIQVHPYVPTVDDSLWMSVIEWGNALQEFGNGNEEDDRTPARTGLEHIPGWESGQGGTDPNSQQPVGQQPPQTTSKPKGAVKSGFSILWDSAKINRYVPHDRISEHDSSRLWKESVMNAPSSVAVKEATDETHVQMCPSTSAFLALQSAEYRTKVHHRPKAMINEKSKDDLQKSQEQIFKRFNRGIHNDTRQAFLDRMRRREDLEASTGNKHVKRRATSQLAMTDDTALHPPKDPFIVKDWRFFDTVSKDQDNLWNKREFLVSPSMKWCNDRPHLDEWAKEQEQKRRQMEKDFEQEDFARKQQHITINREAHRSKVRKDRAHSSMLLTRVPRNPRKQHQDQSSTLSRQKVSEHSHNVESGRTFFDRGIDSFLPIPISMNELEQEIAHHHPQTSPETLPMRSSERLRPSTTLEISREQRSSQRFQNRHPSRSSKPLRSPPISPESLQNEEFLFSPVDASSSPLLSPQDTSTTPQLQNAHHPFEESPSPQEQSPTQILLPTPSVTPDNPATNIPTPHNRYEGVSDDGESTSHSSASENLFDRPVKPKKHSFQHLFISVDDEDHSFSPTPTNTSSHPPLSPQAVSLRQKLNKRLSTTPTRPKAQTRDHPEHVAPGPPTTPLSPKAITTPSYVPNSYINWFSSTPSAQTKKAFLHTGEKQPRRKD